MTAGMTRAFNWWMTRVKTRRGNVATVAAALATIAGFSTGLEQGDPLPTIVGGSGIVFAFTWWVCWGLLGWIRNVWENSSRPATPPFARIAQPRGARTQLRHDPNAKFLRDRGFMWRRRHWFVGTGCPPVELTTERFDFLLSRHGEDPVAVARTDFRTWWLFEGEFYWENESYESDDVKALIRQRERQKKRKLDHAKALMMAEERGSLSRREGIPIDVRRSVWRRDGGRCVECGRTELLELDHIIPLALGGSNTEKNLQLLCAECNRSKGPTL